jgi:SAM-dependent methyltransferase
MMHGSRERFDYFECGACGAVQIAEVPEDLARHYPSEYGPFSLRLDGPVKHTAKRLRGRHLLARPSLLGRLIVRVVGVPEFIEWIRPLDLALDSAILDVGSGAGQLLYEMSSAGFQNLLGVDPYIPETRVIPPGIRILKGALCDVPGRYDLLILNHVIEHVADPREMLRQAAGRLRSGGHLLVRTPVAGTRAWRTYGADWVQLDPPRHLIVHTETSMRRIAEEAGFEVAAVTYDSTPFQFWASEQYQRDIPLTDPRSHWVNPARSSYDDAAIRRMEIEAARLNERGDGDQARFYLRRP